MIFFHGSKVIIDRPLYQGSNPNNDYGPSFYLTSEMIQGKLWACKNDSVGFVNRYYIRNNTFENFKILDLTKKDEKTILTWLAILMHFRRIDVRFKNLYSERLKWLEDNYYIDVSSFDVVKGYRADDAYFKFPLRFIDESLSYEDLKEIFMLGNLGIQYAFISKKAIDSLRFLNANKCDESFVGKYKDIVINATKVYKSIIERPVSNKKTYIGKMIENDVK